MNRIIWGNRGWFNPAYGFCPNEAAWKHAMKTFEWVHPEHAKTPYPTTDASCTRFCEKRGITLVVSLSAHLDKKKDPAGVMGLLVHEATHVWQYIRKDIGEKKPSVEFEAYAMHNITTELWKAYHKTRAKLWR